MDDLKGQQQHERELKKLGIEQEEEEDKAKKGAAEAPEGAPNGTGTDTPPGAGGMAPPPNDQIGNVEPAGTPVGTAGPDPVGTNLDTELSGTDSATDFASVGQDLRNQLHAGTSPGEPYQ